MTSRLGVPANSKPFTPHVTLGRVRAPQRGADLASAIAACAASDGGAWTPDAVVLFESRLHPKGAVHEALATLSLQ